MAAKNSMPERAVAQTEVAVSENNVEIREQVHKRTRVRFTGNAPGLNVFTPEGIRLCLLRTLYPNGSQLFAAGGRAAVPRRIS